MALSEHQIEKWSKRGDELAAFHTYLTIKEALSGMRFGGIPLDIYAQGSYANRTNIARDSDVDLVIALQSAFYPDLDMVTEGERAKYSEHYGSAQITWENFRSDVVDTLQQDFFIKEGGKCVNVRGGLIRLPADVLISIDHRHYTAFPSLPGERYTAGVQFYAGGTRKIVNYPRRHLDACAAKDRRTNGVFKAVIRIAKNARNALINDDSSEITASTAPSYFVECLLWNVCDRLYSTGNLVNAYRQVTTDLYERRRLLLGFECPHRMAGLFANTRDRPWDKERATKLITLLHQQLIG